jgi:excisionase family DNA binding protein
MSGRGRWQRVLEARQGARKALGREPPGGDLYGAPVKRKTQPTPEPTRKALACYPWERSELVLSLGEAANRLGVSRADLEAMIAAGKIEALPTGYTRMIPSVAVERMTKI